MRVRARQADRAAAPEAVRPFLAASPALTIGSDYEVHAAAIYEGQLHLQIVDDSDYPSWKPAWLFDVIDPAIPSDWICSLFTDEPSAVLGPDFVASSLEAYRSMVELEPDPVDKFWKRVQLRTSPAG